MDYTGLIDRRAMLTGAVSVTAVAGVWMTWNASDISQLTAAFVVSWLLCILVLATGHHGSIYRASSAYLVIFGLFHGGLLISIALRGSGGFTASDDSWIYHGYTAQAVHLAILGMSALAIAAGLAGGTREVESPIRQPEPAYRWALAVVGLCVQLTGLAIFAMTVIRAGGTALLSGGYTTDFETAQSEDILGYGYLFLGIGPVLAVVAGGRARTAAWTVFVLFAMVALLIGNRGEALFPLVALLVVEARRGRTLRPLWTLLGSVGVLIAIGIIRQTRLTGFSNTSPWSSPLDATAEMGFSLRPITVVLGWHSSSEPFRGGETLFVVPLRLIENLTGLHGGPPGYDDRLFNVEIMERVGPIGGSPIAEGYHNFGVAGVVVITAAIGLALALVERAPRTSRGDARIGIVLLPLLLQVRNSFAPVPIQLVLGFLLLWAVSALATLHEKRHETSRAPTVARAR